MLRQLHHPPALALSAAPSSSSSSLTAACYAAAAVLLASFAATPPARALRCAKTADLTHTREGPNWARGYIQLGQLRGDRMERRR
jgi:hypothetical protein